LLRNVTHLANAALDRDELDFAVLVPTCRDEDVQANPFPASRLLALTTTSSKSVSSLDGCEVKLLHYPEDNAAAAGVYCSTCRIKGSGVAEEGAQMRYGVEGSHQDEGVFW
jgi:hypothetical protein